MNKKLILLLAVCMIAGTAYSATKPFGYDLNADIHRNNRQETNENNSNNDAQQDKGPKFYAESIPAAWETAESVYSKPNLNNAIQKYKQQNYSGCLQELISLSKKDASNPLVYYYMAMSYAQLGNKAQAVKAYEKVLKLNPNATITSYALKGRDCLVGGPACYTEPQQVEMTDFDKFVNSPYGNGFSPELNLQMKELELHNIQKTINYKNKLDTKDIERIKNFDDNKSDAGEQSKTPTNEEILAAIETLKNAGITISVNPYQQSTPMDNQYAELSMLLGNNNNNNNSMMNMMPFLLSQGQNGQNLDPRILQSMMMNNMLPDFTFNNDKKY